MTESTQLTGRIVIAGGTGFLGLNLARDLGGGDGEMVLLSRHPPVKILVGDTLHGTPARLGTG